MPRRKEVDIPPFSPIAVPHVTQEELQIRLAKIEERERYTKFLFIGSIVLLAFMAVMVFFILGVWFRS